MKDKILDWIWITGVDGLKVKDYDYSCFLQLLLKNSKRGLCFNGGFQKA